MRESAIPEFFAPMAIVYADIDSRKPKDALSKERQEAREAKSKLRKTAGDALKDEGNVLFKAGRYAEAIEKYHEAVGINGLQPVYMANLSAAYLQLEQYEFADWTADCALLHSPRMAKARFRRAMARRGMGKYKAAEIDLQTVLNMHPQSTDFHKELLNIQAERKKFGDGVLGPVFDLDFPPVDSEEWDPPLDSDSEECNQAGNSRPCSFYNHGVCKNCTRCEYSHAPDHKSVRDNLGKNVCLNYLLGKRHCGNVCAYKHTKEDLGQGWWDVEQEVQGAKDLLDALNDFETHPRDIEKLENSTAYGLQRKTKEFLRILNNCRKNTVDDFNSRIYEKAAARLDPTTPFILLISLEEEPYFNDNHKHLLDTLKAKTKMIRARNPPEVLTYLMAPSQPVGVLITDDGILHVAPCILSALVTYVNKGGFAVFAAHFPCFAKPDDVDRFFDKTFQLPWKFGSYFRTTFTKNPANTLVKRNPSLAKSYSMKALHLGNVTADSAVYSVTDEPSRNEAPAVSTTVGNGRISFLGDVNAEVDSTNTILAMLGLLDKGKSLTGTGTANSDSASTFTMPASLLSHTCYTQPSIMLLSMGDITELHDQLYKQQIDAISTKIALVHIINDIPLRDDSICNPFMKCIYVTNAVISKKENLHLTKVLVDYVKNGGRLIFGGNFSSYVKSEDVAPLFSMFGLAWSAGDYTSSSLTLNSEHNVLAEFNPFLTKNVFIEALNLANVDIEDVVYYDKERRSTFHSQSSIVFKRVEKGYIGYIGDVNADMCVSPVLFSMMDLLKMPRGFTHKAPSKFVLAITKQAAIADLDNTSLMKKLAGQFIKVIGSDKLDDDRLVELLKSPDLVGVLVLEDAFQSAERKSLEYQITAYIWAGGRVVFCDKYGIKVTESDFNHFFTGFLFLQWELLSPQQTIQSVNLNKEQLLVTKQKPGLVIPENTVYKGVFLRALPDRDVVYSSLGPRHSRTTAVAYGEVGNGRVGYVGRQGFTELDSKLIFAMLGL